MKEEERKEGLKKGKSDNNVKEMLFPESGVGLNSLARSHSRKNYDEEGK